MQYKFIDENENVKSRTIKKEGEEVKYIEATFTLFDVEQQKVKYEKTIREKEAQIRIHQAEMENVLVNHPEIGTIDEILLQAAYVYIAAKIDVETNMKIAEAYKKELDNTLAEEAEIKVQLGIE